MLEKIKCHLLKYLPTYLLIAFIVSVGVGVLLIVYNKISDSSDMIRYFGFTFTIFSVLLVVLQFRSTRDWGKRQLAITSAKEIKDSNMDDVKILNKAFNYLLLGTKSTIKVDDIHDQICQKKEDGELYRDDDGKLRVDDDGNGYKVKRAISNRLNEFEYIAVGVYQNVFDREIIKALFAGPLIKTYYNFKDYITHYNEEMSPGRKGKVWINLVELAKDFENEELATSDKRKEAGL